MYIVKLDYFDQAGLFLGTESILSPGKNQRALIGYIKEYGARSYCGMAASYVYAKPETGDPVMVKFGGNT